MRPIWFTSDTHFSHRNQAERGEWVAEGAIELDNETHHTWVETDNG